MKSRAAAWPRHGSIRAGLFVLLCGLLACNGVQSCLPGAARARALAEAEQLRTSGRALQASALYRKLLAEKRELEVERGLGLSCAALRRFAEAEQLLAPVARQRPQDAEVGVALVAALVGQSKLAAARAAARRLSVAQPELLAPRLFAAALAQSLQEMQAALAALVAYEQKRGTNTTVAPSCELLHARATLHGALGDVEAAKQVLERAAHAELVHPEDAVWLAEAHLHAGRAQAAEWLLERVSLREPRVPPALRLLAEIALDLEHHEVAASALAKLPSAPELPMDALLRARAELGLGQTDSAIARLQALLPRLQRERLPALAAQAGLVLGRALVAAGRFEDARKTLVGVRPIEGRIAAAELELQERKPEAAIQVLRAVLAEQPNQATANILLGSAYERKGQAEQALAVYRQYAERNPLDPRAHYFVGRALEGTGDAAGARAAYVRSIELAAGSIAPLTRLLILLERSGDRAGAEERVRSQIKAVPQSGAVRRLLGELFERRGELSSAEASYKAGIEVDPEDPATWLALGEFYRRTGREVRGLEVIGQVLQRVPDHAEALALAAQLDAKLGRTASAIERYERALVRRPRDAVIQNNLALLLADAKVELDRALALAQQAQRSGLDAPQLADTLGYVHFRRGELEAALPLLEQAAGKLPQDSDVLRHLGLAQLAAGRRGAGRASLTRALELGPDMAGASEARDALEAAR